MKYTVTIGGNEYDYSKFHFDRKVGTESQTFEGWFVIAGVRMPAKGDTLLVLKEILGTTITKFQGKVTRIDILPGKSGQVHIIAYDMNRKILYLPARALGYSSSKASTILSNEIGPGSSTTDLTVGSIATTDTSFDSWNFGKSLTGADSALSRNNVLDAIQIVSGYDVYIHKDGTVDFKNGAGTDRSATIILEDGMNGDLSPDIGYSEDDTRIVKKVIVKGSGVGITNGNIGVATAGGYASTDKVRQVDLTFLASPSTCNAAAANILTELNKTAIYAKFILLDIISIDYDIFDTVRLKAQLKNKTVDVNLKIFSIKTEVSPNAERHEIVTLELANFNRAVTAPLVVSGQPGDATQNNISLTSTSTQVTDLQVRSASGDSIISSVQQTSTLIGLSGTSPQNVTAFALGATDISGVHIWVGIKIVPTITGQNIIEFSVSDGTNIYPASGASLIVPYVDVLAQISVQGLHIFIPGNLKNKTLTLRAKINHVTATVNLTVYPTLYAISIL